MGVRSFTPHLVWLSAILYYMYQFVLRVSPSVMMEDLMRSFHIDATGFGTLSATSMYFYSALQIPSGLLTDFYGARKVILTSLLLCITGILLFAFSDHLLIAQIGRAFLGAGSAAAFLCAGKISSEWFSPSKRATLLGLTMAAGTLGALNGGAPLSYLIGEVGWRQCLFYVGAFGFFILAINFVFLKERTTVEQNRPVTTRSALLQDFVALTLQKQSWIYAWVALGIYLSVSVLADLWGTAFVQQMHGVSRATAAQCTSLIYIGLCIGSPCLTAFSDRIGMRKPIIVFSSFLLLIFTSILFFSSHLSLALTSVLFFSIGFFAGAEMLCFAGAFDVVGPSLAGTITGFVNTVVMLSGAIIQQQVGRLLDFFSEKAFLADGTKVYSVSAYQNSLSVVALIILLSFLISFWIQESPGLRNRG